MMASRTYSGLGMCDVTKFLFHNKKFYFKITISQYSNSVLFYLSSAIKNRKIETNKYNISKI